ncbi:MAG TPA: NAD-glutamate dehydrogenase, partial [Solimonas sp.]|nr:NAD-glutamate dehydrogenase [Solimonas sp.]
MNHQSAQEQEFLLAQLEALAKDRVPPAQLADFRSFLRHYYEMAALDALTQRSPAELADIAAEHWRFIARRKPGEVLARVVPPADPGQPGASALASIDTALDDMSFIVDSVSMAIRDAGSTIDWAVHPVLRLRRGADGALLGVDAGPGGSAQPESLMHVQFEPLAGSEAYVQLAGTLQRVLADLDVVVAGFGPMRDKCNEIAESMQAVPKGGDKDEFSEAREFLLWLQDEHFTFLGYSETQAQSTDGKVRFVNKPDAALGLSRKGGRFADPDQLLAPRAELDKYAESSRLVVITKANHKSPVRHPEFMDVISVKRFEPDGTIAGTARFLGLFSAEAYIERPKNIPLIRRKAEYVMRRSRLPENSHSGKNLKLILHTLPRDELFQSSEEELFETCTGIRALRDRHTLKLFM